jgi:hypothetical protein
MDMQKAIGKLTEAVESLKAQSQARADRLDKIGQDVDAAKIAGGFILLVAGFLGWLIREFIPILTSVKPH